MAVKYECPKCKRRFTEWGAEKLDFHCPMDEWCPKDATEDIQFVRAGASEDGKAKSPSLKRRAKKAAPVPAATQDEDEAILPDVEDVEEDDDADDEIEEVDEETEESNDDSDSEDADTTTTDNDAASSNDSADGEDVEEGDVEDLDFEDGDIESDSDADTSDDEEWS